MNGIIAVIAAFTVSLAVIPIAAPPPLLTTQNNQLSVRILDDLHGPADDRRATAGDRTKSQPGKPPGDPDVAPSGTQPADQSRADAACRPTGNIDRETVRAPTGDQQCAPTLRSSPIDWRSLGGTYPFSLHVSLNGSDAGYCTGARPCATLQRAINVAATLDFKQQRGYISLDGGFVGAGAVLSGQGFGASGQDISGKYLVIDGNGSATLGATNGQIFNVEASGGAQLLVQNLTLLVSRGHYGIFAQSPGTTIQIGEGITCTGKSGAVACLYAEGNALIESAVGQRLRVQGSFDTVAHGNTGGYVEFDPGDGSTIDCGTGLAISAGGAFLEATANGRVMWSASIAKGCSSVTGDLIRAYAGGSVLFYAHAVDPPGDGYTRVYDAASSITFLNGLPIWRPSLGLCPNGIMARESTNYAIYISFAGPNASCEVRFGKALRAAGYFASPPVCTAASITGGAGPTIGFSSYGIAGFTLEPSLSWKNAQAVVIHCLPLGGG